jgi:type II secretory pathway component PulJ
MLSTGLSTWAVMIAGFALIAVLISIGLAQYLRVLTAEHLKQPSTRKLAAMEEQLAELTDVLDRLAARDKMRKVRAQVKGDRQDTEPDPYRDPEGWKKAKRAKLGLQIAKREEVTNG